MKLLAPIPTRTTHLERSFIAQRRGMAFLAALFPIAFLTSTFLSERAGPLTSISAYYWASNTERNLFVGVLCTVGVFLVLYKGYTWLEDRILDLAGVSAVGIAFAPMKEHSDCVASGLSVHGVFAVTFFSCIAVICLFMSEKSLKEIHDEHRKKAFRLAYRLCSGIMAASIIFAVLVEMLPIETTRRLCEKSATFWLEAVAVWAFSAFWYIKTRELDPSVSWIPFGKKHLD